METLSNFLEKFKTNPYRMIWVTLLAFGVAQTLQSIFLVVASILSRESIHLNMMIVIVFLSLLSSFLGGAFQGRILGEKRAWVWLISGLINELLNRAGIISYQDILVESLIDPKFWMSICGGLLFWYLGAWGGQYSNIIKPHTVMNDRLIKGVAIGVIALIFLNLISWASIHLSKNYKLASQVKLPLPPETREIDIRQFKHPWMAGARGFETESNSFDQSLYSFYKEYFSTPSYENVSEKFQDHPPGEWYHVKERIRDENLDFYFSSAHWTDLSGHVHIWLSLRGEKIHEKMSWDTTRWKISGAVVSQPYAEPPTPTPHFEPNAITSDGSEIQ